jgi:N12 class adenine-specific DNA methylase
MQTMLHPSSSDAQVKSAQNVLNRTYDAFVQKHGYIAKRKNYLALREDPDVYTMLALEEWAPKAEKPEKAAIFTKRTLRPHTPVESVGTPKEALLVSLNETGRVNWPRMAELTGESEQHCRRRCRAASSTIRCRTRGKRPTATSPATSRRSSPPRKRPPRRTRSTR